jgi:tricarballylate dehydrogenase
MTGLTNHESYDVIIVGAGNTALLTASRAHELGARVLVLEKAPKAKRGGNGYFTTGIYRIVHNGLEDLRDLIPDLTEEERNIVIEPYTADDFFREYSGVTEGLVDPSIMEMVVQESNDVIRWMVKKLNIKMELTSNFVHRIDGKLHFVGDVPISAKGAGAGLSEFLFSEMERKGIELHYETGATKLLLDENDKVIGVTAKSNGRKQDIKAKAVVLACGGFESNPEWRARYLGPNWDMAKVRGTMYNMGEGLKMAMDIGAQPTGNWSGCHAIFIDADAPQPAVREDTDKSSKRLYIFGLVLNANGDRFLDEGEDNVDLTYARFGKHLLTQPQRTGFQLFDAKGYATITQAGIFHDYVNAPYTRADTIEDLAQKLGMDPKKLSKTVMDFNAGIRPGGVTNWYKIANMPQDQHAEGITPEKSSCALPIDQPPYYAYAINCGITFTYGGIRVNRRAQVLDTSDNPIPGLYASGEIIGGLFYNNYPGATGQLSGAVFARIAGTNSVQDYQD